MRTLNLSLKITFANYFPGFRRRQRRPPAIGAAKPKEAERLRNRLAQNAAYRAAAHLARKIAVRSLRVQHSSWNPATSVFPNTDMDPLALGVVWFGGSTGILY